MYADFCLLLEKRTEWLFSNIQQIIAIVVPLFCHPHSSSVIVLRTTQYAISLNVSGSWTVCVCVFFCPTNCATMIRFQIHMIVFFSSILRWVCELIDAWIFDLYDLFECCVVGATSRTASSIFVAYHLWQNNVNVECVVMTTLHISYVQLTKYWFVWYLELLNTDTPAIRPNCAPQYILSYLKLYV